MSLLRLSKMASYLVTGLFIYVYICLFLFKFYGHSLQQGDSGQVMFLLGRWHDSKQRTGLYLFHILRISMESLWDQRDSCQAGSYQRPLLYLDTYFTQYRVSWNKETETPKEVFVGHGFLQVISALFFGVYNFFIYVKKSCIITVFGIRFQLYYL